MEKFKNGQRPPLLSWQSVLILVFAGFAFYFAENGYMEEVGLFFAYAIPVGGVFLALGVAMKWLIERGEL